MSRKKISPKNPTKKNTRARDPIAWRYGFLTLCCGLVLVVGFFFAARQHFSSIDFSIKNSKLKKQIDELEAEKRRLQLDKEIALTPSEIKKAAEKIGFTDMMTSATSVIRPNNETPKPEKTADAKQKQAVLTKPVEAKPTEKKLEKPEPKKAQEKNEKEKSPVKAAKN